MHRIVTGDVVRPSRLVQGYPPALEAIVMKALASDPAQRYQSAGLLLEALESFAVSSRMSLSTMGLGRFMRDMFGEVQEPWLNTAATKVLQQIVKENTISSTNSKSSPSQQRMHSHSGIADEDARYPDSEVPQGAKTLLDPPEPGVDWNAPSFASAPPTPYPAPPGPRSGAMPAVAASDVRPDLQSKS